MRQVRISVLGSVRIAVGSGEQVPVPGVLGALAGYLVLHASGGRYVSRGDVAVALWPDRATDASRRALADALYRLRQFVPGDAGPWLLATDTALALSDVWTDLDVLRRGAASDDPADWAAAVDCYGGDLVADVDAEWVTLPRLTARQAYLATLARAWRDRFDAGDDAAALALAERWTLAEPLDERAHEAAMRAHARLGNVDAALALFEHIEAVLRDELGATPGPELRALATELEREAELARRGPPPLRDHRAPFVGRLAERRRLVHRLERAERGDGGVVVVLGEAGIGKTRLLEELAAAARWRGWHVSWGRGEEFREPAPNAPFAEALAGALAGPRADQVADLVGSQAALDAARVGDRADMGGAVRRLLDGLARIAPQLLVVDDAQWADEAMWPLLQDVVGHVQGVLVVLAGRIDELREQPLAWDLVRRWDAAGDVVVQLGGLDRTEIAELARAAGHRAPIDETALLSRCGGNPLLALAVLADETGDADLGRSSLAGLFDRWLAALGRAARAALEAAAVLGRRVDYRTWRAVADGADLALVAGELERAGLIVIEDAGHAFAHDTLRHHVLSALDEARGRVLHERALRAVAEHDPDDVHRLLTHAEGAGDRPAIARYAHAAGVRAHDGASFRAAARHFGRALDVLPAEQRADRYAALAGRARAYDVLADRDAQRADVEALQVLANELGDPARLAEARGLLAALLTIVGDYAGAEEAARAGLSALSGLDAPGEEAALLRTLSAVLRERGQYDEAVSAGELARARYRAAGDRSGVATMTDHIGGIAWRRGELVDAARHHREAAALFAELGDLLGEARALNNLGTVEWALGAYLDARRTHERALAVCRELEDRRGEGDNLDNLGGVAWALGDYETAIQLYGQALTIRRTSDDPWGEGISLLNLGDAHRALGAFEASLRCHDEALEVSRRAGVRRNVATALQGRGLTLLDAGRYRDAIDALTAAAADHTELGDADNLLQTKAGLALALLRGGDVRAAHTMIDEVVATMRATDRPELREEVHLAAHEVLGAAGEPERAAAQLGLARNAMLEATDRLDDSERELVLARVPLHRRVAEQVRAAATRVDVTLTKADAPLGRPLGDGDTVSVTWTIAEPGDAAARGTAAGRQRVLRRLLAEAAAQGAAPTDDDLARALGVSRRTILRDMEVLAAEGVALTTRRRQRSAG